MLLGTSPDFLTTRISYKLNLRGPSYTVQTACSTSLVAVHLACESLLSGACDMALAGGVSVTLPQEMGYLYVEGGTESPDGFCRAFDEEARGTVSGNGVGVVVLKRLSAAERDGDPIHAVVRGSAINNDGALKVGYTAPGIDGQAAVVAAALDDAGVGPETIGYVEAHGTATPLGDPIEIAALTQAYQGAGLPPGSCAIGAVKTNVGHLDASAGIAGLIKTVLALEHKTLPASLHFRTPNPEIDFAHSPFYVNAETRPWAARGGPRRAGVSAFGIGGTNAHVVLEEAPEPEPSPPGRPCQLLVLSARTPTALERATEELMRHLEAHPGLALADVAHTLRVGRRSFPHRRVVIGADAAEAIAAWQQGDRKRILTGAAALSPFDGASSDNGPQTASSQRLRPTAASETPPAVVFLFPGQGSQYPRMTEELYRWEPVFREQLDRCAELAEPHLGRDLRSVLYRGADEESGTVRELDRTCITQPALFAVEYALAMLWHSWGVRPAALIGHSIGEYVAACLAGVFSLEEALALVCERGRLVQQQPGGSMLAVELAEDELRGLLREPLALAAVNGPVQCVVSGPAEAVAELAAALAERGITHRRLKTSHAFHSGMLEPMLGEFAARVTGISLEPPRLRFVSNLTGTWITAGEATNPAYWVRQLRETVRFDAGLREILKDPGHLLLEVGPGRTLTQLARAYADRAPAVASLAGARRRGSELAAMLTALGRLWLAGVEPDWAALPSGEKRRRVPLPSYPFERRRFWIDAPQEGPAPRARALDDWFYVPSWKRLELPPAAGEPSPSDNGTVWLVFAGAASLAGRLVRQLGDAGASVLLVRPGARFARLEGAVYELPARQPEAFAELVADLLSRCPQRVRILHLWHLDPLTARDQILDRGFYSLILLAQALAAAGDGAPPVEVLTISSGLYQVTGNEPIEPLKATLEGAQRVLPQEFPGLRCRSLEVVLPEPGSAHEERLVGRLLAEAAVGEGESVVAYRGRHRWVQIEEPIRLPAPSSRTRLKRGGVYLLTGGLGGIALGLAGHLARELEARLVLVARTAFPERARWETLLADPQTDPRLRARLAALREIESCGGRILIVRADVTRRDEMERAIAAATQAFGPIDGVLHAAGVAGGTLVRRQSPEIAERVLAPKIDGTLVLDELFRDRAPGFLVLFSSLAAVVGGLGQADYCAANAFLDAFAQQRAAEGRPVVAIDWDRWPGIGMAAEPPAVFGEQTPSGLDAGQGFEALHRILATDCAQLLVSVGELSALRRRVATLSIRTLLEPPATPGASRHPRPELSSAYAAPQGGIEEQLAEIWKALLGIDRIGRDDDFFELGGHSLMATRLISRLPREFRVSLSLQALFDSPTLAEFARAIESAGEQPPLRPRGERIRRRARELVRLSVDGGEIAIPKPG